MPEPHPGLDEGPRFLGVRLPRSRRGGSGFGRADQRAFFARCSPLTFDTRGRQLIECGGEEETPHHIAVAGEIASEGLSGRAAIGRHADGARWECRGNMLDDATGEGAARAIGHFECVGQWFFARELEANGQAEVVTWPAR